MYHAISFLIFFLQLVTYNFVKKRKRKNGQLHVVRIDKVVSSLRTQFFAIKPFARHDCKTEFSKMRTSSVNRFIDPFLLDRLIRWTCSVLLRVYWSPAASAWKEDGFYVGIPWNFLQCSFFSFSLRSIWRLERGEKGRRFIRSRSRNFGPFCPWRWSGL